MIRPSEIHMEHRSPPARSMEQKLCLPEGILMRRRKNPYSLAAAAAVGAGVLILFSLVLPSSFWWFLLGVGLIVLGISLHRRC